MFTGIVEVMGLVAAVVPNDATASGGNGFSLTVANASIVLSDVHIGDSISVNEVGIAPETLRKTNLGELKVGDKVNLERAMSGSTRFGGHFVQGHVDTTVTIASVTPDPPNSLIFQFTVPPPSADTGNQDFLQYIVPKGYITLDGTSLTVIDVDWTARTFSVMLIPHTQASVVMPTKAVGAQVNLEVDQMGKYVENMVRSMLSSEHSAITPLIERAIANQLAKK